MKCDRSVYTLIRRRSMFEANFLKHQRFIHRFFFCIANLHTISSNERKKTDNFSQWTFDVQRKVIRLSLRSFMCQWEKKILCLPYAEHRYSGCHCSHWWWWLSHGHCHWCGRCVCFWCHSPSLHSHTDDRQRHVCVYVMATPMPLSFRWTKCVPNSDSMPFHYMMLVSLFL